MRMVYEWDAKKAQRAYYLKFAAAWLAAVIVAGLPVMMVVNAMRYSDRVSTDRGRALPFGS